MRPTLIWDDPPMGIGEIDAADIDVPVIGSAPATKAASIDAVATALVEPSLFLFDISAILVEPGPSLSSKSDAEGFCRCNGTGDGG